MQSRWRFQRNIILVERHPPRLLHYFATRRAGTELLESLFAGPARADNIISTADKN